MANLCPIPPFPPARLTKAMRALTVAFRVVVRKRLSVALPGGAAPPRPTVGWIWPRKK